VGEIGKEGIEGNGIQCQKGNDAKYAEKTCNREFSNETYSKPIPSFMLGCDGFDDRGAAGECSSACDYARHRRQVDKRESDPRVPGFRHKF
jgi:hypothetical protein